MNDNYEETINESKEATSEAMIYIFQTLKSLDERILKLEDEKENQ